MNLITQFVKLIPFNNKQPIKPTPPLDKCSAIIACIGLNIICSFTADKTINYFNDQAEKSINNLITPDPEDPVIQKNKYTNSGVYLSCMLIVNIVVISKLFSISPAKPSLIAASVLAVGRHVYRDWCEKTALKDQNIYGI